MPDNSPGFPMDGKIDPKREERKLLPSFFNKPALEYTID